jgi:hypothetical protein
MIAIAMNRRIKIAELEVIKTPIAKISLTCHPAGFIIILKLWEKICGFLSQAKISGMAKSLRSHYSLGNRKYVGLLIFSLV